MEPETLTQSLKELAHRLGFARVGICPAQTPNGLEHLHRWLHAGYAGEMRYLPERREAYAHPRHVLDGVRSLVLLATPYSTSDPQPVAAGQGRIARYAWGTIDYHDLIQTRLRRLREQLAAIDGSIRIRGVVDTAPLLEREFAQLAGLGWIGKNTMLINRDLGSWSFLAALLVDRELVYDSPYTADHCGTCTACLDACPTHALVQPRVLDATRCISYLTIEHRTAIPKELRSSLGDWFFGCDICQEVCPWNSHVRVHGEPIWAPASDRNPIDLVELFSLDDSAFRKRFRTTPLWRAKRRGLLRNAAMVLGNQRDRSAIPALTYGMRREESVVREACAWALRQYDY